MVENLINYVEAIDALKQNEINRADYWKPEVGVFQISLEGELETFEFTFEDKLEKRAKIIIDDKGKKFVWTMGVGSSLASSYGQLVAMARGKGNKLKGTAVTVRIVSDGKKRTFLIDEAAEFVAKARAEFKSAAELSGGN